MGNVNWTTRARAVFATLARRGKASLRDLREDLGIQGKGAQSSLVQSIARWAAAGLVGIERKAPHNAPRYALTPAGRAEWDAAIQAARARVTAFFPAVPRVMAEVKPYHPPPRRSRPPEGTISCPECSERYTGRELRQMEKQFGRVACTRCNCDLGAELKKLVE